MLQQAIEDALRVTKRNITRFGDQFPHVSTGDEHYTLNDNTEWTAGFWSGILWLCSEYSEDSVYREQALRTVQSFRRRMDHKIIFDHHDIGFLYSLSSKAQWIIERDEGARQLTLEAADMLMKRWREEPGLIQAWGREGMPLTADGSLSTVCLICRCCSGRMSRPAMTPTGG